LNRTTTIFIALAVLLAHILAIHQTLDGGLASAHELAHVAFRIGRNLVHDGVFGWSVGQPLSEAYPSPLWVLVCAGAERFSLSPIAVTQGIGLASALLTVVILAQFSSARLAGLISLTLLAVSGSAASAASSGTEATWMMLVATLSFLAYQQSWRGVLAVSLSLLVLTRPEGGALAVALFALELRRWARSRGGPPQRSLLGAFIAPLVTILAWAVVRWHLTGATVSATTHALLQYEPDRWWLGLHYVWSFYTRSGAAVLFLIPLIAACVRSRRLGQLGRRSLLLCLTWTAIVILGGGDGRPFWIAMTPILPILFLAIQEGITFTMDSQRRWVEPASWGIFLVGLVSSASVSLFPTNLGPLPLARLQREWMRPSETMARAYPRSLARLGLAEEIRDVARLRALGVFLRDQINDASVILTPWPGAVGYLSRKDIHDLLGRARPTSGQAMPHPWQGAPRLDLIKVLESRPDYIVVGTVPESGSLHFLSFVNLWLVRFHSKGMTEETRYELVQSLLDYELVSVPVPASAERPDEPATIPFLLLRRKDLDLAPQLEIRRAEEQVEIFVSHRGHDLVADLEVRWTGADGSRLFLRPTAEYTKQEGVRARTDLLLFESGQRSVRLIRFDLPQGGGAGTISAALRNPASTETIESFSLVSLRESLAIPD